MRPPKEWTSSRLRKNCNRILYTIDANLNGRHCHPLIAIDGFSCDPKVLLLESEK